MTLEFFDDEVNVVRAGVRERDVGWTFCRADTISAMVEEEGGFAGVHGDFGGEGD